MRGEAIRERLHAGSRVYGTHVCSLTNPVTAAMQATLEYDFVFICNEHMPIDRTETSMMCQFYASRGISPAVRIPSPDPTEAAMALDGGAQGVVVPYVETVAQVRDMVGATKYRPLKGERLESFLRGDATPDADMIEFFNRFNRDVYLIIGIESVPAVERLDDLLAVAGVDGVFVGPHDMTLSMGIPEQYTHPDFDAVLGTIISKCRAAGKGVGIHFSQTVSPDERYIEYMRKGMNWVLYGADVAILLNRMTTSLAGFREAMGDGFERDPDSPGGPSSCLGLPDSA